MYVCFACIYVCVCSLSAWCPWWPEEGTRSPWTGEGLWANSWKLLFSKHVLLCLFPTPVDLFITFLPLSFALSPNWPKLFSFKFFLPNIRELTSVPEKLLDKETNRASGENSGLQFFGKKDFIIFSGIIVTVLVTWATRFMELVSWRIGCVKRELTRTALGYWKPAASLFISISRLLYASD